MRMLRRLPKSIRVIAFAQDAMHSGLSDRGRRNHARTGDLRSPAPCGTGKLGSCHDCGFARPGDCPAGRLRPYRLNSDCSSIQGFDRRTIRSILIPSVGWTFLSDKTLETDKNVHPTKQNYSAIQFFRNLIAEQSVTLFAGASMLSPRAFLCLHSFALILTLDKQG